jgi:hypothetical protein
LSEPAPYLLPHLRVELALRTILGTPRDVETWAIVITRVLDMRAQEARDGWWN